MATNKTHIVTFEFSNEGEVLGRATWLGPGMVEVDFPDKARRKKFEDALNSPERGHGPLFDLGGAHELYADESRLAFAEACWSFSGLYTVERVT